MLLGNVLVQPNICIAQDILENMNTAQDALSGTGYNVYIFLWFDVQAAQTTMCFILQGE